ncbi:fimbrial protein StkG [Enterobacter sp. JS8-1]|uniref:fimbrial protein StkG n=1 Tax=Enterobacter sp. JS8-1 TaxID=3411633 RepID=UPI003BA3780E
MEQNSGAMASLSFTKFIMLITILAFSTFKVSANVECRFESLSSHSVGDFINGKPTLSVLSSVNAPTKISTLYPLNLSPELKSDCHPGDDGENIFTLTQSDLLVGSIDGKGLFKTNIPGIAYSLALQTVDHSATAFFSSNIRGWFLTLHMNNHDELLDNRSWQAAIEFYQLPTFTGIPKNVLTVSPEGGTIGKIAIGDPIGTSFIDHPKVTITVADMAFSTPIQQPTCIMTGPRTVSLGEYDVSDLENDNTQNVYFVINGNCSNTRKITMKLTTSKTTGSDGSLIANAAPSNAAKGVGVIIKWPNDNQVQPNSTSSYSVEDGTTIALFSAALTARLVKSDTEKVTSGTFSAIGTLQFTYE